MVLYGRVALTSCSTSLSPLTCVLHEGGIRGSDCEDPQLSRVAGVSQLVAASTDSGRESMLSAAVSDHASASENRRRMTKELYGKI